MEVVLLPMSAWAWGYDGHEIVAFIAADNLTPAAQSHVASIFGVPADKRSIEIAMEKESTVPDTKFRGEDSATAPWHFIDICLQDRRQDVPARCSARNCVTGKIEEYSRRLKAGTYDHWGAAGDLAFLIHFVGDIHQPLHAANDADRGGNCIVVESRSREKDLHAVWDTTVVKRLEYSIDSGRAETTARRLEQTYAAERETDSWISADDIAWESNQIARSDIYAALQIPVEPCAPTVDSCSGVPARTVELSSSYLDHADESAGHQLAKAGFRLATLLNGIWTTPITSDGASGKISAQPISSKQSADAFVGNRRSKIYAWPGSASSDRTAPQNPLVFRSRDAAAQAGYRAALNCR